MVGRGNGKIFLKFFMKMDYHVLSISVGINGLILLILTSLISLGLNPNSCYYLANTKSTVHNGAKSREPYQEGTHSPISRTQIQIKNTFYSTLRNIARSILKHFKSVIGK